MYCPADEPFLTVWQDGAFNHCFMDTLHALILGLLMSICGTIELRLFYRHGTRIDAPLLGYIPKLYITQLALTALMVIANPARLITRLLGGPIYGFMIVRDLTGLLVWALSGVLVYIERSYDLPSQPRQRHGIHLLIFWAATFFSDSLYLVNIAGASWFFTPQSPNDIILLLIFALQLFCELFLFILGFKAPGILSNQQRNQFIYKPIGDDGSPVKYGTLNDGSISSEHYDLDSLPNGDPAESPLQQLERKLQNSAGILQDFMQLPRQDSNLTLGIALKCDLKNRYCNVLPYDDNRVLLPVTLTAPRRPSLSDSERNREDLPPADYINASWIEVRIPDIDVCNRYVAAQGPTEETVSDFWLMIWHYRIETIVMLTDTIESSLRKCEQYWPVAENQSIQIGSASEPPNLLITCTHVEKRANYWTVRELFIVNLDESAANEGGHVELSLTHFQMHSWPDHGVPKETRRFLDFWRTVQQRMAERKLVPDPNTGEILSTSQPIVVHCSAGIGRSGVYILMENLIMSLKADLPTDPLTMVRQLRRQRMGMVQTPIQFEFAIQAAIDFVKR